MQELEQKIINWANERGLIKHTKEQALAQLAKTEEEVNELLEAIAYDHLDYSDNIRLESGDVLVTLVIQCAIAGGWSLERPMRPASSPLVYPSIEDLVEKLKLAINKDFSRASFECARIGRWVERAIAPYGLGIEECLEAAYEKIRDRKGKTVNGVFVKEIPAP